MTVIVWDGKTLAADKRSESVGLRRTVTKIRRIRGHLVGTAGNAARGRELMGWWEAGADPKALPAWQQQNDEFVDMVVITPSREVLKFERSGYPIHFEDATFAMGSGRDYALAAMHLGCDAAAAVHVASLFDTGCGDGVDMLMLEDEPTALARRDLAAQAEDMA